eukprot:5210780-Lingulodinium_polyedra.AAC.1
MALKPFSTIEVGWQLKTCSKVSLCAEGTDWKPPSAKAWQASWTKAHCIQLRLHQSWTKGSALSLATSQVFQSFSV